MPEITDLKDPSEWLRVDCPNCTRVTLNAPPLESEGLTVTIDETDLINCPVCNSPFFDNKE